MPHYPHRIRLRGPWECQPQGGGQGALLPAGRRVTMPCSWDDAGLTSFQGHARFTRRFGYPGRIDEPERVWLIGEALAAPADITLNETLLAEGQAGAFAFDVTKLLAARNRLEIVMAAAADADLWGEIALEVRCTAYLDAMAAQRRADGAVEVRGRVKGVCDGPLEVYGLADGRHVHYRMIEASEAGTPFEFVIARAEAAVERVRVELVNVATIWYAWESMPDA